MVVNYFTFGCGQMFKNHYAIIKAKDSQRCRELMFEAFGPNWSIQYDENDFSPDRHNYRILVEITDGDYGKKMVKVCAATIVHI